MKRAKKQCFLALFLHQPFVNEKERQHFRTSSVRFHSHKVESRNDMRRYVLMPFCMSVCFSFFCVFLHIFLYVDISLCMCVLLYECFPVYVCSQMYASLSVCFFVCSSICVYICVCACISSCVCISLCLPVWVYIYACVIGDRDGPLD